MAVSVSTSWLTNAASNFIGYYLSPSSTQSLLAGNAWATSGTYAGDCSTTASADCTFATECANDVLYYDNGKSSSCANDNTCVTMTIFQNSPGGTPSATNIGCRVNWSAYTVYRELEVLVTSTGTASATTATTAIASTTATSAPAATHTATPDPVSESSKAWIAGAVIGPIVGLALMFLACWLWRRQQKRSRMSNFSRPSRSSFAELHGQQSTPFELPSAEVKSWARFAELPASNSRSELPAN